MLESSASTHWCTEQSHAGRSLYTMTQLSTCKYYNHWTWLCYY